MTKYLRYTWLALVILSTTLFFACKKDKVPLPIPEPEPTKWEKIAGHYKVYDTTGAFLYEMDISHSDTTLSNNTHLDSLHFVNFDGSFTFSVLQSNDGNSKPYFVGVGFHSLLKDTHNKRWALYSPIVQNTNYLNNDSIIFSFSKDNILYYIQDVTPYFYCECKQVAVKQH